MNMVEYLRGKALVETKKKRVTVGLTFMGWPRTQLKIYANVA